MKTKHLMRISILVLYTLSCHATDDPQNLCPEITGCTCDIVEQRKTARVQCDRATDPPLQLINKQNADEIQIIRSTFSNISLLNELRKTVAKKFSFIANKFPNEPKPMFDWNWLPSTTTNLSLAENGFGGFRSGNSNHNCRVKRFGEHFSLVVTGENFTGIPTCLPDKVDKMNLISLPEALTEDNITWPANIRILRLNTGGFGQFSSSAFANAPRTLATIWITHQKLVDGKWPAGLPAHSLEKLFINHCQLTQLPEDELQRFGRANILKNLWLSYNNLTDIPSNLPASLEQLRLDNNEIRHITEDNWSTMKNLTFLDLSNNHLLTVPTKMPSTLQKIYLSRNDIYSNRPVAFRHLKNLKTLDLSENKLTTLPEGINPGLETYFLQHNQLSLVSSPIGYDFCTKCKTVHLFGNQWYCNVEMLKMLNWFVVHNVEIRDRSLTKTDTNYRSYCNKIGLRGVDALWLQVALEFMDYFRQPPNEKCVYEIDSLKCEDSGLSEIPKRIPPGLEHISIKNNPALASIPDFKFSNQTALLKLELDNNSLSHVPVGLPSSLTILGLENNKLGNWTNQDLMAFQNLTSLRHLYLDDNNITVLYSWQFDGLNDLNWIGLAGNQLHCDCSILSFAYYYERIVPTVNGFVARPYPVCKTPADRDTIDIRRLHGYFSYEIRCIPEKCTTDNTFDGVLICSKANQNDETNSYQYGFVPGEEILVPASSYWTRLDLSGLELRKHQIKYENLTRLKAIDLSYNRMTEIPFKGLPASIAAVNLSHNEIRVLPSHEVIQQHLPKIQSLDLSFNQIKIIETQVSDFEVINNLILIGNPLICNCTSRPLVEWVHVNLGSAAMIERHQLQELTCHLDEYIQIRKISEVTVAEYCPPAPSVAVILGPIAAIVVMLLLTVVIANVWYQRKRSEKTNADILLGFQGLLEKEREEEENDPETGIGMAKEYKFDAFVSYDPNGTDAEFVISLLEELEDKRGCKLCLNERDFIPGTGIVDNIVECIGASKHVILVLSRSFIESPWCQYEVQVALAELHQRRRSQLLISVLLEDISADEDIVSGVKTLLSLAPGLTVPQFMADEGKEWHEFWNKLTALIPEPITSVNV